MTNFWYPNNIPVTLMDQMRFANTKLINVSGDFNVFSSPWVYSDTSLVKNFDLSGVAWDVNQAWTLITPRHIILSKHYPRSGSITFTKKDGTLVTRNIVETAWDPWSSDTLIGKLDADIDDLPIYPMSSVDLNSWDFYRWYGLICSRNQQAWFGHMGCGNPFGGGVDICRAWNRSLCPDIASGSSGSPFFLPVNDKLVLFSAWWAYDTYLELWGWPNYSSLIPMINWLIDTVGREGYNLTLVDPLSLL